MLHTSRRSMWQDVGSKQPFGFRSLHNTKSQPTANSLMKPQESQTSFSWHLRESGGSLYCSGSIVLFPWFAPISPNFRCWPSTELLRHLTFYFRFTRKFKKRRYERPFPISSILFCLCKWYCDGYSPQGNLQKGKFSLSIFCYLHGFFHFKIMLSKLL